MKKHLRSALTGKKPIFITIGTFILLIIAFMAFGASLELNVPKLNFSQIINQIKLLFI